MTPTGGFDITEPSDKSKPKPGLYLVATPIGNLRDMTFRAVDVLKQADVIACEDTRVSRRLLDEYGITTRLIPYHDHNAASVRPKLIRRLEEGEVVAVISDAGTPLVSDPGYKLVTAAHAAGVAVFPVPGASAPLAALTVAGLPSDSFFFGGFLPSRATARRKALAAHAAVPATLIYFEAPGRLAAALTDMAEMLGGRDAAIARELTKRFEEVVRGSLTELADRYRDGPAPKGEVVVVISPPSEPVADDGDLDRALAAALEDGSVKDAAALVAEALGLPRRRVYARALALKRPPKP